MDICEPEYMKKIWEEIELEEAEQHEETVRAVDAFCLQHFSKSPTPDYDHAVIAQNLALLHEGLAEWVGLMEEDMLLLLYLVTVAKACLILADERDEYKSALIIMAEVDDIVVMASTADASIMAGVSERMVMHLKLPYAQLIDELLRRCYNTVSSIQQLETITISSGEKIKVLFSV